MTSPVASTDSLGNPDSPRAAVTRQAERRSPKLATESRVCDVDRHGKIVVRYNAAPSRKISLISLKTRSPRVTERTSALATSRCRCRNASSISIADPWFPSSDCRADSINWLVTPLIADTTTTTLLSREAAPTIRTTRSMQDASPTEVPPNFITRSCFLALLRSGLRKEAERILEAAAPPLACSEFNLKPAFRSPARNPRRLVGAVTGEAPLSPQKPKPAFAWRQNRSTSHADGGRPEANRGLPTAHRGNQTVEKDSRDSLPTLQERAQSCRYW